MSLKRILNCLICTSISLTVVSCGEESSATPPKSNAIPVQVAPKVVPVKILFIGNSYTSANNLPELFEKISVSKGHPAKIKMVAPGGYRFARHVTSARTLDAIRSEKWDFVILQNQSQLPGLKPADIIRRSLPSAITLVKIIRANNANTKIIYYVTWGRENGDSRNCLYYSLVCTFSGHTTALLEGYGIYQASTGGELALVGGAWEAVVDDIVAPFDPADLWSADGSHPSILGTYLTASVLFRTLFNDSPLGADSPATISTTNAVYVQQIATDM